MPITFCSRNCKINPQKPLSLFLCRVRLYPVEPTHQSGINPDQNKPFRLLVIDDDEPQLKALCEALREQGYETAGFTSPQAGLTALRQTKFDLLLCDFALPEMDGLSFLRAAIEIDSDLVVIILADQATREVAVNSLKAGALDFIQKPFKLSHVLPVVSRALSFRRLRLENTELRQRVQQHTDELQKANQEFESFAHSVSHDLRAPLRAIGGFSNILQKDFAAQIPDDARRLLKIVTSSAAQLSQMIDGLLNFSRSGRQPLSVQPIDVTSLIKQIVDDLRRDQKRQLEANIGVLPQAVGDPDLLKQVFVNLLSNAFKFTAHTEKPSVEIGCQPGKREHTYFVRDNGIGFDLQYAERLFGVFVRLHPETEFEGHGIGLAISHRIIQRHGGRIWAEAELNKGATFFFTLPAVT
jgi:two-component system, sensor histidine kinase and response regulator